MGRPTHISLGVIITRTKADAARLPLTTRHAFVELNHRSLSKCLPIFLSAFFSCFIMPDASAADFGQPCCEEGMEQSSLKSSALGNREISDFVKVRNSFAQAGINFSINYTVDILGNTAGGIDRDVHYVGLLEAAVELDFEKSLGVRGLTFYTSGYQIHGTSISGESIGSIAAVSDIEAYPSWRLFEAWFEQKLINDTLSIRFGQIAADAEFFSSDGGGNFINSTFGWSTISSDNIPVGGPIYPIATPGVRVAYEPNKNLILMAGLWNGDPVGPCPEGLDPGQCNTNGFDFRLHDPPLVIVEGRYSYGVGVSTLPGTLRLGAWAHFADFDDLRRDVNGGLLGATDGTPKIRDGNYGFYAVVDQEIYRAAGDENRTISVFSRVAVSPSDRNLIDFYLDGGIVFAAPFAARPKDVFGLAVAYTGISDHASAFDRDSGLSVIRTHEVVLEASYTAEIARGLTLQPDFQYFWNPGGKVPDASGTKAVKDASVFGLRTTLAY